MCVMHEYVAKPTCAKEKDIGSEQSVPMRRKKIHLLIMMRKKLHLKQLMRM